MKHVFFATVLCLVAASLALAAMPDTSGPGWNALFKPDYSDASKPPGIWSVADGSLTANADQCLWTQTEYANFMLELEFKNAAATNSGVILYATDPKNWVPTAVEIQICDDYADRWSKSPPNWHCGAIFGHVPPSSRLVKPPGEWNRMLIEARGQQITVWLNGSLASEIDMTRWTSAKKNPDGTDIPAWLTTQLAQVKPKGLIGFQGKHGGATIWFRNIRIQSLNLK